MPPIAVVEDVNVFTDLSNSFSSCFVSPVMHEFVFQRSPETFHGCIVVTVSSARHGCLHAKLADESLIVVTAILTAAITVMDQAGCGFAATAALLR